MVGSGHGRQHGKEVYLGSPVLADIATDGSQNLHIVVIWQNWIQFFQLANIMMVKNVFSLTLANIILSDLFFNS